MGGWNGEGLTRQHVEAAIRDIDAGQDTGRFRDSIEYDLVLPDGGRYPPKKVFGVAAKYVRDVGRVLDPNEVRGGHGSSVFVRLMALGYKIEAKGDWTRAQNRRATEAYAEMVRKSVAGTRFTKAEINRQVQRDTLRTRSAIEFKWRNISAVLIEKVGAYLPGYRPADNYQQETPVLVDAVESIILKDSMLVEQLRSIYRGDPLENQRPAGSRFVIPPERKERISDGKGKRRAQKIDWSTIEEEQRNLGADGELFIKRELEAQGARVRHVSVEEGDGLGYDLEAKMPNGETRLIEVKATSGGKLTPFFVSRNEYEVAMGDATHWIYRVFDLRSDPKYFVLRLRDCNTFHLRPHSYEISF